MVKIMCPSPEKTRNSAVIEVGVSKRVLFVCFSAVGNQNDLPRIHQLFAETWLYKYKSLAAATETFFLVFPASCT